MDVILYANTSSDKAYIFGHGLESKKIEMFLCDKFTSEDKKYDEMDWEKLEVDPSWDQVYSTISPHGDDIDQIVFFHFPHDSCNVIWEK